MSHITNFGASNNLAMPGSGLASRRGGQAIKPLSIDAIKPGADKDGSLATPRTSRSHLLAGLRTAPKSATVATFPQSPTAATAMNQQSRNVSGNSAYSGAETTYSGPKTSLPRFAHGQTYNSAYAQQQAQQQQQQAAQQAQQAQQQRILQQQQQQLLQQQQQHYTADQILAPPELDDDAALMDAEYAEIVATNMYLAQQQQRLQQQLMSVQAAQQQFQNLNIGGNGQPSQQQLQQQNAAYQQLLYQQQQLAQQQAAQQQQQQLYSYVDPVTGQQALYVGQPSQINSQYVEQYNANLQQLQYLQLLQKQQQLQLQQQQSQQQQQLLQEQEQRMPHQQTRGTHMFQQQHMHRQASPITAPRVQVSPPPSEGVNMHRTMSPPRRIDSTTPSSDHAPLPPPSANAFRRGHKKASSLFNGANLLDANGATLANGQEMPKSAGPKTATFPPNVMQAGTYGPGQARAGEHPIRQPRGPPNFDELASKPTSKHEGSKNFATRTRRSAVHNLVRAGFSRRQVTVSGSSGSISPISETAEEQGQAQGHEQEQEHDQDQEHDSAAPLTDDESVSGRSGSGSLNGDDVECSLPSSRTSTGSWGAIGSERPGSREKCTTRKSVESLNSTAASDNDSVSGAAAPGSFASVFKSVKPTAGGQQRKAPMVLMKNMEKRRFAA